MFRDASSRSQTAPGPALVVRADPTQLRQALHNMLDNALLHGAGPVCLHVVRVGDAAEFHVTDEGPGFPSEYLPRAFGRFSRADPTTLARP